MVQIVETKELMHKYFKKLTFQVDLLRHSVYTKKKELRNKVRYTENLQKNKKKTLKRSTTMSHQKRYKITFFLEITLEDRN